MTEAMTVRGKLGAGVLLRIVSNNTYEGPSKGTSGQHLNWIVNSRTSAAPMAVLRLGT